MAFFSLALKAAKIQKAQTILQEEKVVAVGKKYGKKIKLHFKQKYRHFWIDQLVKFQRCLKRIFFFPEGTQMHRTCYKLRYDGSCENYTLKSIVGFLGGFLLTYIFFLFFVFQLNFKLSTATIMCSVFGCILTLGLAFSYKIRTIVFLILPQFFSKRGRQALLGYAFILAITGPAKNTLNNMSILSESMACGQEQLKSAVKQILDVIKKPFYAIKDAIKMVVTKVKEIIKLIKEIFMTIKRIVISILKVIKAAFQFLWKIINVCNKELGTPFQRCSRVFENAIADCNAKLGPFFRWMCSITYLVKSVCYIVKIFDYVCMIVDFISNSIIGVVVRKIKAFVRHVKTMFYVRIKFSHSFSFNTNRSKSVNEIAQGIVTEIKQRTENIVAIFDMMTCATSLFFTLIIFKALHYRYKFLTSERFDNRYITKDFRKIDFKRAYLDRETVLPLNHREKTLYVPAGSCRLIKIEKRKLSKSATVLLTATLKLCTHMATDYALYWVLCLIRYHARFQSTVQSPNIPQLHVTGDGFLAKLLRSIVNAFQPMGIQLEIDTVPCLPDPIPPDYDRYVQIASLLVTCWILTIAEPYGLRLRHYVMCYYHPTRARQRSIWLYNNILRSRSSFLKFARRQLRRKVMGDKKIARVTLGEFIRAKCPCLDMILGPANQKACLLCGEVFREDDKVKPIYCATPGCQGIYCEQCFVDLQNLCTICLSPVQYGDISDISEEKDSSETETEIQNARKPKKKKKKSHREHRKVQNKQTDSDTDSEHDQNAQLLKPNDKTSSNFEDSDYNSDFSTSTQYSYGYQDQKDVTSLQSDTNTRFKDLEMQKNPDYASMNEFYGEELPQRVITYDENVAPDPPVFESSSSNYKYSQYGKKKTCNSRKSIVHRMWRRHKRNQKKKLLSTSSSSLLSDVKPKTGRKPEKTEEIPLVTLYTATVKQNNPFSSHSNVLIDKESKMCKVHGRLHKKHKFNCMKCKKNGKKAMKNSMKKRFWKICSKNKETTTKQDHYILESDSSITDYEDFLDYYGNEELLESSRSMLVSPGGDKMPVKSPKVQVPRLNLSFLNTQRTSAYPGDKFGHITYKIIDETPRTTSSSGSPYSASSRSVSSSQDGVGKTKERETSAGRQKTDRIGKYLITDSSSDYLNPKASERVRKRVRKYYRRVQQDTKKLLEDTTNLRRKNKQNKVGDAFNKFIGSLFSRN